MLYNPLCLGYNISQTPDNKLWDKIVINYSKYDYLLMFRIYLHRVRHKLALLKQRWDENVLSTINYRNNAH